MRVIITFIMLLAIASISAAQVVLQKAVIANAGGRAANSTTRLDYTVGEPAVGIASNGATKGQFGFWNAATFTSSVKANAAGPIEEVTVYPNPGGGTITVDVQLRAAGNLDLALYDEAGRLVTKMFSGKKSNGRHSFRYDAGELASGTYFVAALAPGALVQTRLTVTR